MITWIARYLRGIRRSWDAGTVAKHQARQARFEAALTTQVATLERMVTTLEERAERAEAFEVLEAAEATLIERGYWCMYEGMYFTDPAEVDPQRGHYDYPCGETIEATDGTVHIVEPHKVVRAYVFANEDGPTMVAVKGAR